MGVADFFQSSFLQRWYNVGSVSSFECRKKEPMAQPECRRVKELDFLDSVEGRRTCSHRSGNGVVCISLVSDLLLKVYLRAFVCRVEVFDED